MSTLLKHRPGTDWAQSIAPPPGEETPRFGTHGVPSKKWPSTKAEELIEQVEAFASLPDDWDSYGAGAPEADVIRAAVVAIGGLDMHKVTWVSAHPSASGDVGIRFTYRGATVTLSIDEDEWQLMVKRPGEPTAYASKSPAEATNVDWVIELL